MRRQQGFTLMELLVVLLIIGILSGVALRTIDATRDRGLYEQTVAEMNDLVQAVTGNPDLVVNGRRVDYGFYGDMRRLPQDLDELVRNSENSSDWKGPYLRSQFLSDSTGYLSDAWGHPYTYDRERGLISSDGNGRFTLTMRVADTLTHLYQNTIVGTVTDNENSPPGEVAPTISIMVRLPGDSIMWRSPDKGGYFQFDSVPIGTHRIRAMLANGDSIVRWISMSPRSRAVVDFRFTQPFGNYLRMVGEPTMNIDSSGFYIRVVNEGPTDDTIIWITLASITPPESVYMHRVTLSGASGTHEDTFDIGYGQYGTVPVTPGFPVLPNRTDVAQIDFFRFTAYPDLPLPKGNVWNRIFRLRFSDGSEITATPLK